MSDPPQPPRRRLQIKLGRPKPPPPPPPAVNHASVHPNPTGFRISLKRRPNRVAEYEGGCGRSDDDSDGSDSDSDDDDVDGQEEDDESRNEVDNGGEGEEDDDDDDDDNDDNDQDGSGHESGSVSMTALRQHAQSRDSDDDESDDEEQDSDDGDDERQQRHGRRQLDDEEDGEDENEDEDKSQADDDEGEDSGDEGRTHVHGTGHRNGNGRGHHRDERHDGMDRYKSREASVSYTNGISTPQAGSSGSRPIKRLRSKGLYEALPKLIDNLKRRDSYKFFWEPVDLEEVPNYLDYISHPMDLGTMEEKVRDRIYSHMDEFKRDFLLVVENAQTFNPVGTLFHGEGKKLQAWGTRAIEREGMAVNDNGRAGIKGDMLRKQREMARLGSQSLDTPTQRRPRKTLRLSTGGNAGLEALIDAARLKPGEEDRAVAALAMANAARSGRSLAGGSLALEDMDVDSKLDGDDLDSDADEEMLDEADRADERPNHSLGERSATLDPVGANGSGRRLRRRAMSPSTPAPHGSGSCRQASPDALRKRLAVVTGTPLAAFANGAGAGSPAKATPASKLKLKHRLGPPGTPRRLAAVVTAPSSGAATPASIKAATQAASAAAAAAATAASAQAVTNYTYAADGSIDPDDIEDLQSFFTLRSSSRPILMPTIESLHPLAFVPQRHSDQGASGASAASKKKERERDHDEKEADKDKADKDKADKDKADKDKADKDPLSTLPPSRPGLPDPLFTAIAPAPEPYTASYSHDMLALPSDLAVMPFHVPSAAAVAAVPVPSPTVTSTKEEAEPPLPSRYENLAYVQALQNESRPKKTKDKEREKEKDYTEDWTYFRPNLVRLLECRDLGPWSTLSVVTADGKMKVEGEADVKRRLEASLNGEGEKEVMMGDVLQAAAGATTDDAAQGATKAAAAAELLRWSRQVLRRTVWHDSVGEAYARSLAEFASGAMESPFVWQGEDEATDRDEPHRGGDGGAKAADVLPGSLADYVATQLLEPLSGGMLGVVRRAHDEARTCHEAEQERLERLADEVQRDDGLQRMVDEALMQA
ncbi:hypothetical protein ACQY0O_007915 [Thecaphora frezii]